MYVLGLYKVAFEDILETAVKAKYMIQVVGMENMVHVNDSKEIEISITMNLKNVISRDHFA